MKITTFSQVLNKFRQEAFSERDKGFRFERLMQTYLKTDGDLASYPVLCQAFNQFSFNVSEKDMALKSAINLYDSNFDLRKINQARMSVLKEVQAEQATLRQKQSAQSR